MLARRSQAVVVVMAIVVLAAAATDASASPARRLARRGVLPVPPPGTAVIPPAGPLRPNPLLAVPIVPGGPALVVGPAGRVRRRLAMPADIGPAPLVTVTETVRPLLAAPPVATAPVAVTAAPQTMAAAPAPVVAPRPATAPQPLAVEQIPAPLPQPQAATGGVVPAGGELEIHDGTQSVLVPAGNEQPVPAGR